MQKATREGPVAASLRKDPEEINSLVNEGSPCRTEGCRGITTHDPLNTVFLNLYPGRLDLDGDLELTNKQSAVRNIFLAAVVHVARIISSFSFMTSLFGWAWLLECRLWCVGGYR